MPRNSGRIRGGVVQVIGTALYERIPYDDAGQPLAGTRADYLLPGAADPPRGDRRDQRLFGRHGNQGWADGILYTTGEPCPMCMSAIVWAGIGGVIYGSSITTLAEADIPQIMIGASVVRDAAPFYRRQIMGGALRAETNMLLRNRPIADGAEAC